MQRTPSRMRFVSALVLSTVLLAACGGPTATPAPANTQAPADTAVVAPTTAAKPSGNIVVWMQEANQDQIEQTILDDFQAEYPDITVEFVNYSPQESWNQLSLAIQGGTGAADVVLGETQAVGRILDLGGLTDLTELIAPYRDNINAPMLDFSTKDGKVYAATWDVGPVMLYYRRDIFEAAGLPTDPNEVNELVSTWDKFLGVCQTILDETGLPCFASNKANNYGTVYTNMLWQQGLGFYSDDGTVTIDSPENVATLEKLGEFWDAGVVSEDLEWTDGWYAALNAPPDDPNVKAVATIPIAAWMGGFLKNWAAADRSGDWGVVETPAFAEGQPRSANQGGSTFVIPEQSQNKEAAWAFIEYIIGREESQIEIFKYGDIFPALETTYSDPVFSETDPYFADQPVRELYVKSALAMPKANIYGPYASTMSAAVATAVQKFAIGEMSAADALKEAADSVRLETGLQ
jgi:lactose/L-arabinose transport system substrate-binding protein